MKTFKLCLAASLIVVFSACSQVQVNYDPDPPHIITIMHFSDLAYTNNLIVTDYKDIEKFVLMRGNECMRDEWTNDSYEEWPFDFPIIRRSPYIELTEGWYLIDWTWLNYPYDGQIILTDITWENYDGNFYFDKSLPHITNNNFYETKFIKLTDLMEYSYPNGQYPTYQFKAHRNDGLADYYEDTVYNEYQIIDKFFRMNFLSVEQSCACGDQSDTLDKMWEVLRQQITTVIKNGDLENIIWRI